jgi:hypothetical protein
VQKREKRVLYKHINSAVLQAAEDPSEITLRYLTGEADIQTKVNKKQEFAKIIAC